MTFREPGEPAWWVPLPPVHIESPVLARSWDLPVLLFASLEGDGPYRFLGSMWRGFTTFESDRWSLWCFLVSPVSTREIAWLSGEKLTEYLRPSHTDEVRAGLERFAADGDRLEVLEILLRHWYGVDAISDGRAAEAVRGKPAPRALVYWWGLSGRPSAATLGGRLYNPASVVEIADRPIEFYSDTFGTLFYLRTEKHDPAVRGVDPSVQLPVWKTTAADNSSSRKVRASCVTDVILTALVIDQSQGAPHTRRGSVSRKTWQRIRENIPGLTGAAHGSTSSWLECHLGAGVACTLRLRGRDLLGRPRPELLWIGAQDLAALEPVLELLTDSERRDFDAPARRR